MTYALLVALVVGIAGLNVLYVRHLEAKDRRHDEQVNRLLQRIQAPEVAVAQAASLPTESLPAVSQFDDDDHWDANREALERIARIEAGEE